jgi:hypothetical protein
MREGGSRRGRGLSSSAVIDARLVYAAPNHWGDRQYSPILTCRVMRMHGLCMQHQVIRAIDKIVILDLSGDARE